MQRSPFALLVKWEDQILDVQQGLVSASHRGVSRTKGELLRMLSSDHCSPLPVTE